jgi:site-specific DNA-methyltransferase (adenine-specific)
MLEINKIYCEDCLTGMTKIDTESIDMILTDLPYGTTRCKWDVIIPFEPMWTEVRRILKPNSVFVTTAAQPFVSLLITSNLKMFKYDWMWDKKSVVGHLNAKIMPLRRHEHVLTFCTGKTRYYPQMRTGVYKRKGGYGHLENRGQYGDHSKNKPLYYNDQYYPTSVLEFPGMHKTIHPTQKPSPLFEYLIDTYTQKNDLVLDICMGSGTTAIACLNTGRNFIGFENNEKYFALANERIAKHAAN